MDKKVVVCIPVYKAQRFRLLDYIANNPIDGIDYYYITQENDSKKNVYNEKYGQYPFMHEFTCNAINVAGKRYAYYNYFIKKDYDYLISVDDDILEYGQLIDGTKTDTGKSYKCKKVPLNILFNELIKVANDKPNLGIVAFTRFGMLGNIGFLNVQYNKSICFTQFLLFNLDVLRQYPNVNYTKNFDVFEDIYFGYKAIAEGVQYAKIGYMTYLPIPNSTFGSKDKSSTIYTGNELLHELQIINTYKMFGGKLKLNNKNQLVIILKPKNYINVGKDNLRQPYSKKGFDKELDNIVFSKSKADKEIYEKVFNYLKSK